jgi:hypothetical protein
MFFRSCRLGACFILLLSFQGVASTISIQYSLSPLGGNVYSYIYSVTNNGSLPGGASVRVFDVLFDPSLYQESSLLIVTPSGLQSQWTEQFLAAVPPIPPTFDVSAPSGGIPSGQTLTGFAVQFKWLGSGLPGSQPFEIYDPATFQLLQSGETFDGTFVPEPSGFGMIALALAFAARKIHRRRT